MNSERWSCRVEGGAVTVAYDASTDTPDALLILGHGAGSNLDSKTVTTLRDTFVARDLAVVRFHFLYKEAGKSMPDRMPVLMRTYQAVADHVRDRFKPKRLLLGGHSMGGRTGSMLAAEGYDCDGLILCGYPLHPAGKPEKLRDEHLPNIKQRVICFNGTRDELCTPDLMNAVVARLPDTWTMHWLEHADHSLVVQKSSGRTNKEIQDEIGDASLAWLSASYGCGQ